MSLFCFGWGVIRPNTKSHSSVEISYFSHRKQGVQGNELLTPKSFVMLVYQWQHLLLLAGLPAGCRYLQGRYLTVFHQLHASFFVVAEVLLFVCMSSDASSDHLGLDLINLWLRGKATQWKLKTHCKLKFLLRGLNLNPQWTHCLTFYWVMFDWYLLFPWRGWGLREDSKVLLILRSSLKTHTILCKKQLYLLVWLIV